MKICVIHPKACKESAIMLAKGLGAKAINPRKERFRDHQEYDVIFNYGLGEWNGHINKGAAVVRCIDKLTTFRVLLKANVPIPKYVTAYADVPKNWNGYVCRETATGAGNEGLNMFYDYNDIPKDCVLYTEYFEHVHEWRVVVFKGVVVARYKKEFYQEGDNLLWNLRLYTEQGFENIDRSCLQAAEALQIDFVGFDVLENKKGVYVVLEANSGPVMTEEVLEHLQAYFKELKK